MDSPSYENILPYLIHADKKDEFATSKPDQPKAAIAEYVERKGVLVPRRFSTYAEAIEHVGKGGSIMIRSEHADEYGGVSGLTDSHPLEFAPSKGDSVVSFLDELKTMDPRNANYFLSLCFLAQTDEELAMGLNRCSGEHIRQYTALSHGKSYTPTYSYWQMIYGTRGKIIKDHSVPGVYHLHFGDSDANKRYCAIDVTNNHTPDWQHAQDVLDMYERVCGLEKFNQDQCPIVEFVVDKEGKVYFLQYQPTRTLDALQCESEIPSGYEEAFMVRGRTEGGQAQEFDITMNPGEQPDSLDYQEGGVTRFGNVYEGLMARVRSVVLSFSASSMTSLCGGCASGHVSMTHLYVPPLGIELQSGGEVHNRIKRVSPEDHPTIRMSIISDGVRAGVRVIED